MGTTRHVDEDGIHDEFDQRGINVQKFGARSDKQDNWADIQSAIDYVYDRGGGFVWVPSGSYKITKPLILWRGVILKGPNRETTFLEKTTNDALNDGSAYANIDAVLLLANRDKSTAAFTQHQRVRNITLSGTSAPKKVGYGICAITSCPYLKVQYVWIRGCDVGVQAQKGLWLASMEHINISGPKKGISILANSTSLYLNEIYVFGSTETAYELTACVYSHASNLAADQCTGTVYSINYGNITFSGCGSESMNAAVVVSTSNGARAKFTGCSFFANKAAGSVLLSLSGSMAVFDTCDLGFANTDAANKSAGTFMSNGVVNSVNFVSCSYGYFADNEPSEEVQNHYNFTGRYGAVGVRESKMMPFVGWDRDRYGQYVDSFLDVQEIYGKAIFLDNQGHPFYDNKGNDRQYGNRGNKGDWFLINNPMKSGHAAYITAYDTGITHTSLGTISAVNANVYTLTDLTLDTFATDGTRWQLSRNVTSSSGGTAMLAALDYAANTVTLGSITGTFNVGDKISMPPRDLLRECTFVAVPVINSGKTLERPTSRLIVGQEYFDTELGKPIWWKGAVWVDATGATV